MFIDAASHAPATRIGTSERRRHRRVSVSLLGRYMLSERHEYPCQVTDMSPGGAALVAPVRGGVGERVVCHIDHVGRLEGVVTRRLPDGFAIEANMPLIKREKLAEKLTWLANRQALGIFDSRRHARLVPRLTPTTLTLPDGMRRPATLLDVSLSGAALACDARPAVGSAVTVGATPARVVRVGAQGLAVAFDRLLPADGFDDAVKL